VNKEEVEISQKALKSFPPKRLSKLLKASHIRSFEQLGWDEADFDIFATPKEVKSLGCHANQMRLGSMKETRYFFYPHCYQKSGKLHYPITTFLHLRKLSSPKKKSLPQKKLKKTNMYNKYFSFCCSRSRCSYLSKSKTLAEFTK
jgi:hypothetical protein